MNYEEATQKAEKIKSDLHKYCRRVEIAGSIRRGKKEGIKDIEIVCIPETRIANNMFGDPASVDSLLEISMREIIEGWRATTIKNGKSYKQIVFHDDTKLDLFIVTPETWGVIFALRTGPADYSHQLVTPRRAGGLLPSHLRIKDGRVWHGNNALDTPDEQDFFSLLGMNPMPHPSYRIPNWKR